MGFEVEVEEAEEGSVMVFIVASQWMDALRGDIVRS